MIYLVLLSSLLIVNNIFSSMNFNLEPIFSAQHNGYSITVYNEPIVRDMILANNPINNLLNNTEIENLHEDVMYVKEKQIAVVRDFPKFDYRSTLSKNKILYTENIHQCAVVGIYYYRKKKKKRVMFHLNYFFENNVKKREKELKNKLNNLRKKNKKCIISLVSGFYSPNIESVWKVINETGYEINYCNIKPLYMFDPLQPYEDASLTFFVLSDDFDIDSDDIDLNIENITEGNKLAILPDGQFVRAILKEKPNFKKYQKSLKKFKKK